MTEIELPCKHRWIRVNKMHVSRIEWFEWERCKRCDTTRETHYRTKIYSDGRTFTDVERKFLSIDVKASTPDE